MRKRKENGKENEKGKGKRIRKVMKKGKKQTGYE